MSNAPEYETPPPPEEVETVDWKPVTVNDELVGTLTRRMVAKTKFGDKEVLQFSNVTTLISDGNDVDVPDGHQVTYWPTPGALAAIEFGRCGLRDRFGLKLVELVDTDKGNPFKKFAVGVIARAEQAAPPVEEEPF